MAVLTSEHNSPNSPFWTSFVKIWNSLTEPAASVKGITERRQARLVASLLAVIAPLGMLSVVISPLLNPTSVFSLPPFVGACILFMSYGISRTRYHRIAAVIMLVAITLGIVSAIFFNNTATRANTANFLIFTIILASILFSARTMLAISALHIVAVGLLPTLIPGLGSVSSPIILLTIVTGLLFVAMRHRNELERARKAELSTAYDREKAANDLLGNSNKELVKANALARESVRLKSEFMSTMSHELRTPLNAILGFCSILLEGMGGEIDGEAQHMLSRVESNSQRLLGLINDVLDLAKIEAGRMELVSQPFAPRELVEKWRGQVNVLAEQKGLAFHVEIDPQLPDTLWGDGERLTQIAVNLLSNAFKFTETGSVTLDVKLDRENWLISVVDTGVGIPPHALNFIFEEFRQVDGSSRRVYGGSGLGLAIVRNLCVMMNGSVRVTSELGKGSVFTISLPLITQNQTEMSMSAVA